MQKLWISPCFLLFMFNLAAADIGFISDRDGKRDFYVMNDHGGHLRKITDSPFKPAHFKFSPDGTQVAFSLDLNATATQSKRQQIDIFLMNADGKGLQNLTEHPALDSDPTWSPDGEHLAFTSGRSGQAEIHIMEVATRRVWQLTDTAIQGGYSVSPAFSPDGTRIAYSLLLPIGQFPYVMDVDGRNARPLLKQLRGGAFGDTFIMSGYLTWSPDGHYLLYNEAEFARGKGRVANRVRVVQKNGRSVRTLDIPPKWKIDQVCWADGGDAVLFAAVRNGLGTLNGVFKIYKYQLSNKQITTLTHHPSDNWGMDWTPHNSLNVSATEKLTTQWARLKAASRDPFILHTPVTRSN